MDVKTDSSHTHLDLFLHMARACMVMQEVGQGTTRETSNSNVVIPRMEEITLQKKAKLNKNLKMRENYTSKEQQQPKEEKPAP